MTDYRFLGSHDNYPTRRLIMVTLCSRQTVTFCPVVSLYLSMCFLLGPLAAEILSLVWGTPANFNWFRVMAALLHGTLVVGVSYTLRR